MKNIRNLNMSYAGYASGYKYFTIDDDEINLIKEKTDFFDQFDKEIYYYLSKSQMRLLKLGKINRIKEDLEMLKIISKSEISYNLAEEMLSSQLSRELAKAIDKKILDELRKMKT